MRSRYGFSAASSAARRWSKYDAPAGSAVLNVAVIWSATRATNAGSYQKCGLSPSFLPTRSATVITLRLARLLAPSMAWAHVSYPAPLTMTTSAIAMARESFVLLAYSWGSAFGSVTTLWTSAWLPPIWAAMLPQKFSAATTRRTDPPEPPGAAPLHAATTASTATATTILALIAKSIAQVTCSSPM